MAMEPITLYARIVDPAGVARLLCDRVPTVEIDGPDDGWRTAVVRFGALALTFTHGPEYYAEPTWSVQMNGMAGYLARFPETERKKTATMLPTTFKFSLGTLFDPEPEADGDPRFEMLYAVAELLDGILFTPSSLRDARGRILYGAGGEDEEDPVAQWPRVIAEVSIASDGGAAISDLTQPETEETPTAERVARRALALTALTARAILEQSGVTVKTASSLNPLAWARRLFPGNRESERQEVVAWIQATGIADELDPNEWEIVQRPIGRLESQEQINSTWRLEGLVVLAWALGLVKFPRHDKLVDFNAMWRHLGLLDVNTSRALLANPTLRPRQEIAALRNRLFAVNWRLTEFRLRRGAIDYAAFARTAWFGPLDAGLPLVGGDLAIQGVRIDEATPDAFDIAHSAGRERHQAINWLWEGPKRYADASVDT